MRALSLPGKKKKKHIVDVSVRVVPRKHRKPHPKLPPTLTLAATLLPNPTSAIFASPSAVATSEMPPCGLYTT